VAIGVETVMSSFVEEVAATPGGEKIWDCIQCGVCTGSCPAAGEMEYPPRKIIAMIRAGMRDEVLSSSSMWYCLSCYMCTARCPKDIKPTELAHALESLSVKRGFKVKGVRTPAMYRSFVNSIKLYGRVHELGMMMVFYLKTGLLWATNMLPLAFSLFRHGRIPLKPHRIKGRKELKQILSRFAEVRDTQ
jgi:heterodisulfide reductase subunit C